MKNLIRFFQGSGLLFALCLISSSLSGQSVFSGTWALNESKSNMGEMGFRFTSPVVRITQDATTFTIEKTFTTQDGEERKLTEKYTLDGKESLNSMFNTTKKSVATWSADKKSILVNSSMTLEYNGESNEIKTAEKYFLDEAGKQLNIDSQSSSQRGERKYLLVYDKK